MLYKLVTNVLVNRLRPYLSSLIRPFQVSFTLGWQAADSILVAQELIHTIRRNINRSGLMADKIDLEKAYDRIKLELSS